ncbi:MAG: hypothetical protein E4H14_09395 [Candidatus Thorarchaeota archaeon]|nr:MAG: hypothetical protein E4H14_09395 [Candidatus Thorarchaeota archaeon]
MLQHPLYPNGNIYLSGGMQHAKDLGAGWRKTCSEHLRAMRFFPLDIAELDIAYTEAHGQLYRFLSDDELLQRKSNIRKHFIDTDINLIRNDSDAIIILYDESVRRGAGTTSEVHEAFMQDIPVFLLNTFPDLNEVPGWMQAETTRIFQNWNELYYYFDALPPGILKRDIYGNRRSGMHYLCSLCGRVEEKHKTHYVSRVSPLYCKSCVELVKTTHETHYDRYQYFMEYLATEVRQEMSAADKSKRGNK